MILKEKKEGLFIGVGSTGIVGTPVGSAISASVAAQLPSPSASSSVQVGEYVTGQVAADIAAMQAAIAAGVAHDASIAADIPAIESAIVAEKGYATIAQVGSTTTAVVFTSTDTLPVPVPTGVAAGDIVFVIGHCSVAKTISAPTGFTELCDPMTTTTGDDTSSCVYYKIATGSDTGTYDVTWDSASGSNRGWAFAFRNVDNSTPFDVTVSHATHHQRLIDPGIPFNVTGITTNTGKAVVVQISLISRADTTAVATDKSGSTELFALACGASNGACNGIGHWEEVDPADSYGVASHTYTDMVAGTDGSSLVFALKPAGA